MLEDIPIRWPLDAFADWRRRTGTEDQVWAGASRLASFAQHPGLRIPPFSGFELTLLPPIHVDWSVAINRRIERLNPLELLLGPDPVWERLRALLRDGAGHDHVRDVILEFDTHLEGALRPGVFVQVTPPFADSLLADLAPMIWRPALREQVARIIDAAGNKVTVCYFGFMFSRPSNRRMRLCLGLTSSEDVDFVLGEIGWEGRRDVLKRAMNDLVKPTDVIQLALDVGDDIVSSVGIEIRFLEDREKIWHLERWASALDTLTRGGLCAPEMASAILQWRGGREYPLLFGGSVFSMWQPSHVKLSLDPHGKLSAKAYLLFRAL